MYSELTVASFLCLSCLSFVCRLFMRCILFRCFIAVLFVFSHWCPYSMFIRSQRLCIYLQSSTQLQNMDVVHFQCYLHYFGSFSIFYNCVDDYMYGFFSEYSLLAPRDMVKTRLLRDALWFPSSLVRGDENSTPEIWSLGVILQHLDCFFFSLGCYRRHSQWFVVVYLKTVVFHRSVVFEDSF